MILSKKRDLTQARLKELVDYDPESGVFTWKVDRGGKCKAGSIAGYKMPNGYCGIGIDHKWHQMHAIAWLYMTGTYPDMIDHVDMDGYNNKFANLRICDKRLNTANRRVRADSKSGFKGVEFLHKNGRWRSYIKESGKKVILGTFDTAEEAHAAYVAKAKEVFGEFARAA